MPLKRILDARETFDPKTVAIPLTAFDEVVAELGLQGSLRKEESGQNHHPARRRSTPPCFV
jgi:hypothetical protein